ncbi:MAG: MATE family efflux transporter [Lentisphaeria bacterium]|nr:MATE family efflux transporter [Lentisphaeria bacterium]
MKTFSEFDSKGCYSYKKIAAVTVPILLSMLMEHIIGMTDTAFLGRVSEVALGASALGTVYFLAFFVLGTGFSFGAQILIARRNGEGRYRRIGRICYAGGFFLVIFSLLTVASIRYLSPVLLPRMIKSADICAATMEYLDWRAWGLFFTFISAMLRAFYVGIAQTMILTLSSVVMVLANVLLNYALIFGRFGLPEMGIAGAALALTVAEGIAMLFYVVYTVRKIDLKKYGFDAVSAVFSPGILKKVLSVSAWMMLQPFLSISVWFFFFLAVEHLGERSLAVTNLARSLSALPFIIIHAFATAANSLVSNLLGAGKTNQVWPLIVKIILFTGCFVTPLLISFILFPAFWLHIYTDNQELVKASLNVVYVMSCGSFIQIAAFVLFNSVSGTGAVKTTVAIEFFNLFLYVIFVWYVVIYLKTSPAGAWSAEIVYQGVMLVCCLLYLLSGKWKDKKL